MDIVSTFNPPRLVQLAGKPYWVRALTLADFACILAWLDDVTPGRADRKMPPEFGSEESQRALESAHGRALLVWLALRDQGVSYAEAADIAIDVSEIEGIYLERVLFGRRRTMKPGPPGEDIGVGWWGPVVASFIEAGISVDAIAGWTLDQLEMGCMGRDRLNDEDPRSLTLEDVVRMGEEKRAAMEAINGSGS